MARLPIFFLVAHLLIFLSKPFAILAAESTNTSELDRWALLYFKKSIYNDSLHALRSWHADRLDFCSWTGVTCGKALPLRVVSLELNSLQLDGELSQSLANLTSIRRLDLGNNSFYGGIPEELGTLPKLQILMLASNKLLGGIPGSLGITSTSLSFVNLAYNDLNGGIPTSLATSSSLTVLNLTSNYLSGPIPDFHKMPNLRVLVLTENNLSGSIPPSLGNASSLTEIFLNKNNLGGSIPETISQIRNLSKLVLGYNHLMGQVPDKLYNISSLILLDLSQNNLTGRMPPSIGCSSPNLQRLIMQGNRIEGLIPTSLANASNLNLMDLSDNRLAGAVPSLGSLSDLYFLYLGSNYLESDDDWTFLASLTNCTKLEVLAMDRNILNGSLPRLVGNLSPNLLYLNFYQNRIFGPIPAEIGNLTGLVILSLGQNQLVDKIPIEVWNLPNLQELDVNQNLLSGEIPFTIANLQHLVILNLSSNRLTGQIPSAVGNFSMLVELHLANNNLSGNIPVTLGNCKQLVMLNISYNKLYGSIPSQLFKSASLSLGLDLSHNNLTGSIPPQIGHLINLIHLDVSFNNLSGEAPSSLGQCVTLQYLNMERNVLNGSIPQSFINLKSISLVDLSRNNFSGEIPDFFGNFSLLAQLDLSNNNFEGPIPTRGVFQNTTSVILDGNMRLCAIAPTFAFKYPICPNGGSGTKKNARLLFIVIPPITIVLLLSLLCFMVTLQKKRTDTTPCYKETMKKVSFGDILKATNCLSPINKISSSCTGSIYIGRFEFDTDLVAIKVFHLKEHGSLNNFFTECEVLRSTRHRNLMKAVTLCSTVDLENNEFKAIVFHFMANGSLDMWVHPKLHKNCPKRGLSLGQRIRIAMDVASALDYMHNQLTPPLVHRDLKPANVLLDYDMTARIGDFGSAKFLSSGLGSPNSFVGMAGTIGYIAPEYGMGYKISTGCDVYSFGVLLLEMLTGMRPTDALFTDGMSLHKLVRSAYPNGLFEVLDPYMSLEVDHIFATLTLQSYLIPLFEVALLCSMELPKDRPGMRDVCAKIGKIREAFLESW